MWRWRILKTQSINKMTNTWNFQDAPNTACYTTTDVLNGSPVTCVYHDFDGDWQFHAASNETTPSSIKIVCLSDMISSQASLAELYDLPYGWQADWNDRADKWEYSRNNPFPSFAENGYYLEDAVWLSEYLADIQPPPAEIRDNLAVGMLVKLVFRFAAEDADRGDGQCERMWVNITAIDEENDCYVGALDNDPHHAAAKYGDTVAFHSLHVADLYRQE